MGWMRAGLRVAMPVSCANPAGTRIAYQVIGNGPVDIAFSPSLVSNLGAMWDARRTPPSCAGAEVDAFIATLRTACAVAQA